MATDTMTAPDLDALERLLADLKFCEKCGRGEELHEATTAVQFAAYAALPALLATARRERRMREFGAWLRQMRDTSTGETHTVFVGVEAYFAALAEEGQDG